MKNTNEVLKENGVKVPPGVEFKISENTDKVIHLNLPTKSDGELSEIVLKDLAAGLGPGQGCNCGCGSSNG